MEKIRNLSIRKSIVLYVGIAVIISFLLSILCMWSVEKVQQNIWRKYVPPDALSEDISEVHGESGNYGFSKKIERIGDDEMSSLDTALTNLCDFIDTWCIPIITMLCCILSICLFYRNKIKRPLELLEQGSRQISGQRLDFQIRYDNKDEMGRLCAEFETMRAKLVQNNRKMWRMLEQERTLRTAIAHDIRSPLAIIKGYQETLKVFIPAGKLDETSLLEIADSCLKQVDRLDQFAESMKKLSKVEEREISPSVIPLAALIEHLEEITRFLNPSTEITCTVSAYGSGEMEADAGIICEVYENLLANALRYARGKTDTVATIKGDYLELCVQDDGEGFKEDVKDAIKAYTHGAAVGKDIHFGLGLYLCDVYCQMHGGYLQLENLPHGGASAKAVFRIK